jgi:hypothetical protein
VETFAAGVRQERLQRMDKLRIKNKKNESIYRLIGGLMVLDIKDFIPMLRFMD